jgi:hypothetical protein
MILKNVLRIWKQHHKKFKNNTLYNKNKMSYFVKISNLSSIQDIVNSFTQVITQQNALITALQSGLSTGDANTTGLVSRVTANEATLGSLGTITTNSGSAIGVLQSAYTTTSNAITALNATTATNTADITTNSSAIGVLQSASTTNTTAIANINLDIIALVNSISTFGASIAALQYKPPLPILHWDFVNFLDKVYGIPFANPFGIVLSNGSVVVDQTGPDYYLEATLPIDLLSKYSKTFMFKFKSYPGLDTVTDFVVSTYGFADPRYTTGFSIRIRNGEIVVTVSGLITGATNSTKDIYLANHPIPGFPASIFDEFFHSTVVIYHVTDVITSFINGVGNMSTAAINAASATAQEVSAGTYYGNGTTTPFFVNKFNGAGNGTGYYKSIMIFNSALTPSEVQYYYDQQSV